MERMLNLEDEALENPFVRLEPLGQRHFDGLERAANSGVAWDYMPQIASGEGFAPWFEEALAAHNKGDDFVFVVRRRSDESICGSTRFLNIVPAHFRCEIGWTWYTPDAQGSVINPSTKLLLFAHAFDAGANRVELKCDALNERSRAAITRLGAVEEGTLRRHMVMPGGRVRDTVYFSVIREEWPRVREGLLARIG